MAEFTEDDFRAALARFMDAAQALVDDYYARTGSDRGRRRDPVAPRT